MQDRKQKVNPLSGGCPVVRTCRWFVILYSLTLSFRFTVAFNQNCLKNPDLDKSTRPTSGHGWTWED